eukprot:2984151-Amphidinium_carterae.1
MEQWKTHMKQPLVQDSSSAFQACLFRFQHTGVPCSHLHLFGSFHEPLANGLHKQVMKTSSANRNEHKAPRATCHVQANNSTTGDTRLSEAPRQL